MGMSNFKYEKTQEFGDVKPGVYECRISDIRRGATGTGTPTIDFFIGTDDKSAEWNGVPIRKSIIDGDYFDRAWSQVCDCFGLTPEQAAEAIHNFPLFANRKGKVKFAYERSERQTTGYTPDGKPVTEWVKVPTEYLQITFLKPSTRLETGPARPQAETAAQVSERMQKMAGVFEHPDPTPKGAPATAGGFPEDIPF